MEFRCGCVIMASGMGRRFGGNKLLADFGGKPMIQWALETTSGIFDTTIVVTRNPDTEEFCRGYGYPTLLHNEPFRSDTIRIGMQHVGASLTHCMFCMADQPLLRRESIRQMIEKSRNNMDWIIRASYNETAGAPILFPGWCFSELCTLPEGKGGNVLCRRYPERVITVQVGSPYELMDIDTSQDLLQLEAILHH